VTDEQPTVADDAVPDETVEPEVTEAPETPALPSYSGHPPRSHNPHVYQILDAGKPESVTVTQRDIPADEVPAAESTPDADPVDYEAFTKDDLVAECKERELPVTGNKPDLADRLRADDAAKAAVPAESGE
jgi:SAP domain